MSQCSLHLPTESTARALEALLKYPSACLPAVEVKHHGFGFAPVIDSSGNVLHLPQNACSHGKTDCQKCTRSRFYVDEIPDRAATPTQNVSNMAEMDPWLTTLLSGGGPSMGGSGMSSSSGGAPAPMDAQQIGNLLLNAESMDLSGLGGGLDGLMFPQFGNLGAGVGPTAAGTSSVAGLSATSPAAVPATNARAAAPPSTVSASPPFEGGARIVEMEDLTGKHGWALG